MKNLKFISVVGSIFICLFVFTLRPAYADESPAIWSVRSVDTMKLSRDKARAKKDDKSFDDVIRREVSEIKDLGANYVALGTPYDDEFLPYLRRWVAIARENGLHVWYRGTFSSYEGWFDHSKSLSPNNLLEAGKKFIAKNQDLFEDGDIFDLCPECENGGYWPQPRKDGDFNQFIQEKNKVLTEAFASINKKVIVNYPSIIGGRSKDVLTQDTFDALGNVTAIDHYANDAKSYDEYMHYFMDEHRTKVLFSEFGAPIPDLHGKMTQASQAAFVRSVFETLYAHGKDVIGVNYWVLSGGTTSLYDETAPREVVEVIKDYYQPGVLSGTVKNSLRQPLAHIAIQIDDHEQGETDATGSFAVAVPAGEHTFSTDSVSYRPYSLHVSSKRNEKQSQDIILYPTAKSLWYSIRERFLLFTNL